MRIHSQTIQVLKHFSEIHKSLTIPVGNTITTITPQKTVVARAITPTSFERQFTIYDLKRFLSVASLLGDDADFDFRDGSVVIRNHGQVATYTYADDAVIKTKPPQGEIKMPSLDAEFKLSQADLKGLRRAAAVLGLPQIAVIGEDGAIMLKVIDVTNPLADTYSITVGETNQLFTAILKLENLILYPDDYHVVVTRRGMAKFTGPTVTTFIALEHESKFEDATEEAAA